LGPMNLTDLVEWTMQVIPDGQKNAFAAAQRVTLRLKKERAQLIVASATIAAAGTGAFRSPSLTPIYLIVPIQISMLASITATFGLRTETAFFTTLVSSTLAGAGGTLLGRSVLGAFLLLIPGAGPFLNGLISGVTAGLFTTAFGEAHIAAISHLVRDNYHPTAEEISSRLREEMGRRNLFHKKKTDRDLDHPTRLLSER
jgi:uncharacterized protein (DUF697 family)